MSSNLTKDRSYLEQLPAEIREMIFRNLLSSSEVRESSPETDEVTYNFQPAILSVNRAFQLEARHLLYQKNTFVLVSTNNPDFFSLMGREGVPTVSSHNPAGFKGHHLYVQLNYGRAIGPRIDDKNRLFFLMLAQDLPLLVRMIKIHRQCFFYAGSISASLQVYHSETGSTLKLQRELLEPFKHLDRWICRIELSGAIEPTYRLEVDSQVHRDLWIIRNNIFQVWSIYEIARDLKREGDHYFTVGNLDKAAVRYGICRTARFNSRLWSTTNENSSQLGNLFDSLTERVFFNEVLLNLRRRTFSTVINAMKPMSLNQLGFHLEPYYGAKMWHYLGLARAMASLADCIGDSATTEYYGWATIEAIADCEKALVQAPDDVRIRETLKVLQGNSDSIDSLAASLRRCIEKETIMEEEEEEEDESKEG